jgi:hypothetical protein
MAIPIHAVLINPEGNEERDIEIRHTDSFLLVRAGQAPPRPRDAASRSREQDG